MLHGFDFTPNTQLTEKRRKGNIALEPAGEGPGFHLYAIKIDER